MSNDDGLLSVARGRRLARRRAFHLAQTQRLRARPMSMRRRKTASLARPAGQS